MPTPIPMPTPITVTVPPVASPPPVLDGTYRYDGGPAAPVPPANGALRPAQTVEPPLAALPAFNRVKAAPPQKRTVVYPAYGETIEPPRPNTLLVKGQ